MIVRRETPLALYKGLGAVLSGIVPKMAIRFASFEKYKAWLADKETGKTSVGNIFIGTSPPLHTRQIRAYRPLTPDFCCAPLQRASAQASPRPSSSSRRWRS